MTDLDGRLARPGCLVRYADLAGPGRPVVLLHGAGADHATFEPLVEPLAAAGHRVALLDLRGHGLSRPCARPITADQFVADVESLVHHLGLDRPVLIGHSLGGNIGQALLHERPAAYAGLAVLDATKNDGPLTSVERLALRATPTLLRLIPAAAFPRVLGRASGATAAAQTYAEQTIARIGKRGFSDIWRATSEFVGRPTLSPSPVPLLLLRGELDRAGNIAQAVARWAAAEGIEPVIIRGAGHLAPLDAPIAVADALLDFLGRIG